jgi:succinate dehydrogenase / fumarate reductase cytochrome b subunit
VAKFRFIEYPESVTQGLESIYFVKLDLDEGLYGVAGRLDVKLYDAAAIQKEKEKLQERMAEMGIVELAQEMKQKKEEAYNEQRQLVYNAAQKFQEKIEWVKALESKPLKPGQVMGVTKNFGTAELLVVRDTFKDPLYVGLYTIFVLAACFHAFNGLWTFMITWGVVLRMSAQRSMVKFCWGLMALVAFLGLISVWGTYWLNLRW